MPIKIRCICGNFLLAPEERIGQTGVCPSCKRSITVERPKEEEVKPFAKPENKPETKPLPNKRKRSFIHFILSFILTSFVYLTFVLLLAFIIGLHTVALTEVDKLVEKSSTIQENWLIYRDIVETVRDDQKDFFQRRIYQPIVKSWCAISSKEKPTQPSKTEQKVSPKPETKQPLESPLKPTSEGETKQLFEPEPTAEAETKQPLQAEKK